MRARLEVCCSDVDSLIAAKEGGASRIELCSALSEGGLTPSMGLIEKSVLLGFNEINVLVRSRKGDFLYSGNDMDIMIRDVEIAKDAGATGIVWGALLPDGSIDQRALERMMKAAEGLNFTFHRAFDLSSDPISSLEQIIDAGCSCILTSGLASSAYEGINMIANLNSRAIGRIDIMAGSGVNASNCREIVDRTGVKLIHATARCPQESRMTYRRPGVSMGIPGEDEYIRLVTSAGEVRAIIESIS